MTQETLILDQRLLDLQTWALNALGLDADYLSQADRWQVVSADASQRKYYRILLEDASSSFIVVDAPPAHENLDAFIDIAGRLRGAGLLAPKIIAKELSKGFMLLQDFGDNLLKAQLHKDSGDQLFAYISPLLIGMATVVDTQGLPKFSEDKLHAELALLPNWYVQKHLGKAFTQDEEQLWQSLCDELVASAMDQPQVFVHKDFHSCNLIAFDATDDTQSIGLIDFQDALIGPVTYDLASWLWDRYMTWPRSALERWMLMVKPDLAAHYNDEQWLRCCDFMGLQRNLKIVGIFARLFYRDGKTGYVEMMPQFAAYILDVVQRYEELSPYKKLLTDYLSVEKAKAVKVE